MRASRSVLILVKLPINFSNSTLVLTIDFWLSLIKLARANFVILSASSSAVELASRFVIWAP
ncbi:hypothetical protein [Mycoplasmopsis fermentans]|uniref:hypothetical protein n=1 Tax=Mycoplasmopsis fermentans TaxID=2115 RepID=UPI00059F7513|nr:hypothetical protein [Mycoplasmopsis fermentans]